MQKNNLLKNKKPGIFGRENKEKVNKERICKFRLK
jgi:hypothetical protein